MIMRRLALLPLLAVVGPALAQVEPPPTSQVAETFAKAFADICAWAIEGNMGDNEPEVYDLRYRNEWMDAAEPDRLFRVYEFRCGAGAYNFDSIYYGWDEGPGLAPIVFAEPELDIQYDEAADGGDDVKLKSIAVTGYSATFLMVNADFDPVTGSITTAPKWRGIGDASSIGQYEMKEGNYALKTFDVDPTYDGEITMIRVVDTTAPIDVPLVPIEDAQ